MILDYWQAYLDSNPQWVFFPTAMEAGALNTSAFTTAEDCFSLGILFSVSNFYWTKKNIFLKTGRKIHGISNLSIYRAKRK